MTINMPNGHHRHPPRPFLYSTMDKYREHVAGNYHKAIRAVLDSA